MFAGVNFEINSQQSTMIQTKCLRVVPYDFKLNNFSVFSMNKRVSKESANNYNRDISEQF